LLALVSLTQALVASSLLAMTIITLRFLALIVLFSGLGVAAASAVGTQKLRVLSLSGSADDRRGQHGSQLRAEIAKVVDLWKADLQQQTKLEPDALIKNFLAATDFIPATKQWTPDMLEEVRGIAAGAGQALDTMFAVQLVDELWVYLDKADAYYCSSMGVPRSEKHPTIVAQNMDLESFREGFQVVLWIPAGPASPAQLVFTCARLVAVNGMNNRGVALACNTLMQLSASMTGLPVAFVIRGVLAQSNGEVAVKFLTSVPHASDQNYILGTTDRVFDFEASASKVVPFKPSADGTVYHTNHPLANDDLKRWHRQRMETGSPEKRAQGNSAVRFASVQRRLARPADVIDTGVIRETLHSKDSDRHPVCRPVKSGGASFTFGSVIMSLSGRPGMEVSAGSPHVNPYVALSLSDSGK
jgi:hypothetical protein